MQPEKRIDGGCFSGKRNDKSVVSMVPISRAATKQNPIRYCFLLKKQGATFKTVLKPDCFFIYVDVVNSLSATLYFYLYTQ